MMTLNLTPARIVLTVAEAGVVLGISRGLAYEGVRQGTIPHVRVGKRILVPVVALEKMLAGDDEPDK